MPELLLDEDGAEVDTDVDQEWAEAMAAPPADAPTAEPPRRKPPEPDPDPVKAPHGWTYEHGEWRAKKVAGRPRGDDVRAEKGKPGAKDAPKDAKAQKGAQGSAKDAPADKDYTEGLAEFSETCWMLMAGFAPPVEPWGTKVKAQAAVLKSNQAQLCTAFNTAAHKNPYIRRGVEKVTGPGSWAVGFAIAVAPFCFQSWSLWKAPMEGEIGAEVQAAANATEVQWAEVTEQFRAHMNGQEHAEAA